MAATLLTLVLALVCGGGLWLALGSRLRLAEEPERNDILNLMVFVGVLIPIAFAFVLFLLESL